jgi:hypothetical protein
MNEYSTKILNIVGIHFSNISELNGLFIQREDLLSPEKYEQVKLIIPELKKHFSSSFMTGLQKPAEINQKWPLLNLVRQLLHVYHYNMIPIRKSDGYTKDGIKKYKRYFLIKLNTENTEITE